MELLAWVTAVVYREPGLLAKLVSTLDVLSEGRAWLGVGASWKEEARGLGLPFPPTAERFERPEEALQISLQMWSADEGPFEGEHCRLGRNAQLSAAAVRAASAVLIGGTGEKKTLRLVARYAQACSLFPTPDLEHELDLLRGHCHAGGREYDQIEKTVMYPLNPGPNGENVDAVLVELQRLARLGISYVHSRVTDVALRRPPELLGERVIPVAAEF